MAWSSLRLDAIRAAERHCLQHGVDQLDLAAVAESLGQSRQALSALFEDESMLLDAILERHQTAYERSWEPLFSTIQTPRDAIRMLARSIASLVDHEDGGVAYVSIAAQMCTSPRFPLTGRPATTSAAALKVIGILAEKSAVPLPLMPLHFERFATLLFGSVLAWQRHGAARVSRELFVEDLVDELERCALATPSSHTERALAGSS